MTQHSKQQTVISSQRRHTERCDLTCPHDSKNLSARTYAVSVYDTRELIRGKKISQNFPHYPHSTPLHSSCPLCHPFPSAQHINRQHNAVCPYASSVYSTLPSFIILIHPSYPFGLAGNWIFRSEGTTLSSMCAGLIRIVKTNRPNYSLICFSPRSLRRFLSVTGLSANNGALLPVFHPNMDLSSQIKKEAKRGACVSSSGWPLSSLFAEK